MDQLESIKKWRGAHLERKDGSAMITVAELKWLVEQAEKMKEYEEVLKWYANRDNYYRSEEAYMEGYPPEVMNDRGYKAKQALGGLK